MKLTRVRLEATGDTQNDVRDYLLAEASRIKAQEGGEWGEESTGVFSTQAGHWGHLTIRRLLDGK